MAIVYPQVPEPYDKVFQQIIEGVASQYQGQIRHYVLDNANSIERTLAAIQRDEPDLLIALGKSGYKLAHKAELSIPIVTGALPIQPNGISGVSLIADPAESFNKLAELAPEVKRIFVVYHESNQWLIDKAIIAARQQQLDLIAHPVSSLKQAVPKLQQVLTQAKGKRDAIWIPLDRIAAEDRVIFPMLLEATWDKEIILFSNKPNHAKRGALFSLLPNHKQLGIQLINQLLRIANSENALEVETLKGMDIAVNTRTASHLGIQFSNEQKQSFHVEFPRPQ